MRNVDLNTTGHFRCEISGEAPLFQTAFREAVLAVVGELLIDTEKVRLLRRVDMQTDFVQNPYSEK